ncbi:MAG: hypothetical protein U0L04_07265 [Bacteroidaceae bacterium]|nr:hypothetical protein [Bacteroidaceae bacterium]
MAKGNLLLGTASRSIGDVTMYRRNGQQVSRARVRKIGNPRTEGQAKQRMLQAALTRFYSPLASCLEKSFEGKNKMDSYSKFLAVNNRIGRDMFAVPKNAGWVPVPVKVSGGTMPSPNISYNEAADAGFLLDAPFGAGATMNLGSLSQALMDAYGLSEGDQVTVIAAINRSKADEPNFTPVYFRFFLKPTSVDAAPSFGGVSFVEDSGVAIQHNDDALAGVAVIFSRYENNAWRRSNSFMVLAPNILEDFTGTEGIAKWLDEWMNGTTVPTSDVYLNGSTESQLAPHAGSVTVTINGTSYTFIGSGHRVIGQNDYAYLITSDGERKYLKNGNEKSDQFGKYADIRIMQLTNLSSSWGVDTAPADIPAADIITLDPADKAYTGAIGEQLTEFAAAHGWTAVGATSMFGKAE